MRSLLTTVGEVVGAAAIAVGFWQVYPPAGLIAAGVGAILLSVAAA